MEALVVNLLNGISFGALLFLLASGLSLIFGVMGILNLAHGALYMVGAYVGWTVAVQHGLSFWLAVLVGGLSAGAVSLVMERGFLRHLHGQLNEQALLTFGFVYILANLSLWIWGPLSRAPFTAPSLTGSMAVGEASFPTARFVIIAAGLVLAVGLWWLQNKTRTGAILRAGMDDREMTMGLGINLERVGASRLFPGFVHRGFGRRHRRPVARGEPAARHQHLASGARRGRARRNGVRGGRAPRQHDHRTR